MTSVRRLLPAALVLLWAGTLHAQATAGGTAWTSPCTLDVVLVTFKDTTGQHQTDTYDYGAADLPHGYTINAAGALVPGASSYTMGDFESLLSGGYHYSVNEEEEPLQLIPEWTGTPTVADNNDGVSETLPDLPHGYMINEDGALVPGLPARSMRTPERTGSRTCMA